jgi:hypothetical protein
MRDLALFNVAIDSKLHGCDVVALKVDDLRLADMPPTAQPSDEGRPAGPSNSN